MSEQGRPGRYQRSFGGLLAAMLVIVLGVTVFVGLRSLTQDTPEVDPQPVDYRGDVAALQAEGVRVPYPASLPSGWFVRQVDYQPGPQGRWVLSILTDEEDHLGVVLQRGNADAVVREWVGEEASAQGRVRIPQASVTRWRRVTDPGGDVGYTPVPGAREGDRTLLVYGNAPAAEVRELASRLTTAPVD